MKTIRGIFEKFYVEGLGRVANELSKNDHGVIDFTEEIDQAIAEIKELLPKKRTDKDNFIDGKNKHAKESVELIHLGFNRCLDKIGGLL